MKIGILSRKGSIHSTARLKAAAEARGHAVRVVDYLRCYMNIAAHRPQVIYQGEPLHFDAVIPRIGASRTFYGTAVVRQFEMMGVFTACGSLALARSRDKLRALQILAQKGIGLPVTGFAHSTKDIDGLIAVAGGPPLIVKLLEGTQGIGVVLAETKTAAHSVIAAFRELDANILVQEFIAEARGTDIRALVVGDQVVAAVQRIATAEEFRANVHRGGKAAKVTLSPAERRVAVQATRALGLRIAGVDILRSRRGPVIIEVNSSPGLQWIEECTGIDVAAKIIVYIEKHACPRSRRIKA